MIKICIKCKLNKPRTEFYSHQTHKDGLRSECKECTKKKSKLYDLKYKIRVSKRQKRYRLKNRTKILKKLKDYALTHKQERIIYITKNREKISLTYKIWYDKNKYIKARYQVRRRKQNIICRLSHCLRSRLRTSLNGIIKSNRTLKLIGCSVKQLKLHLESNFKTGMSWENYGTGWNGRGMSEWHIDHIRPCCQFDLIKPEEQLKCFNYKNLQPLWAKENLEKSR